MSATSSHPDIDECLFHYTTAAGLRGILGEKCIWATDSAFLNDLSEIIYAAVEVERHIENLIQTIAITHPTHGSHEWYRMSHLHAVKDVLSKFNQAKNGPLRLRWPK